MVLLLCFVSCQPTCHVFLMTADSRLGGEQYIFKIHFYNLLNCNFCLRTSGQRKHKQNPCTSRTLIQFQETKGAKMSAAKNLLWKVSYFRIPYKNAFWLKKGWESPAPSDVICVLYWGFFSIIVNNIQLENCWPSCGASKRTLPWYYPWPALDIQIIPERLLSAYLIKHKRHHLF